MRTAIQWHIATLAIAIVLVGTVGAGIAQTTSTYPAKDIRIVLPSAPGGGPDVITRVIANRLSMLWPHRVYVENRPGASGTIGTMEVSRGPTDGYTYLSASFGQAVGPLLLSSATYDLTKDLEPVVMIGTTPSVVLVTNSLPVNSIDEFVAYAKANPDKLTYATAGRASSGRLAAKALEYLKGIKMQEVDYTGAGPAYQDIIAGRIDLMVDFLTAAAPRVTTGQLKGLAITASERSPRLPDVPTLREAGVANFQIGGWFGLMAPSGTPADIVNVMNAAVNQLLKDPGVRHDLANLDVDIKGGTPEDLRAYIAREIKQWSALIDQLGLERD